MTIQLMGTAHCATDPVIKNLSNGKIKAEVPVYITDIWTDFTTGQIREVTNHFRCVFWGENAKRADKLLKKGLQIIITSAKLRNIQSPQNKNITYTQIWVDRWEVPSKVMMTKSFYEQIYKSELMPYKVCLFQKENREISVEVHVDRHDMATKSSEYFKNPFQLHLHFMKEDKALYKYLLYPENIKFSNAYYDIYGISFGMDCTLDELDSVDTQLYVNAKAILEHDFPINACIHQEKTK